MNSISSMGCCPKCKHHSLVANKDLLALTETVYCLDCGHVLNMKELNTSSIDDNDNALFEIREEIESIRYYVHTTNDLQIVESIQSVLHKIVDYIERK